MALIGRQRQPGAAAGGFAVLDVETTGQSQRTDRIVKFAIVHLNPTGAVVAQRCSLRNPERDVGPDVLVVADAASTSTKARRARELRIRIMTEAVLVS